MAAKVLGVNGDKDYCMCCGKKNIKRVVWLDVDGEIVHYGTTCASEKHLYATLAKIEQSAYKTRDDAARKLADDITNSAVYTDYLVRRNEARRRGLRLKEYAEYKQAEFDAMVAEIEHRIAKIPHRELMGLTVGHVLAHIIL